jgi:transcriptional regulator with GAF, ATPase, and Fis domain
MADDHSDIFKKSQEFLQMLSKQKDFIQDLLKENERLRFEVANLRQRGSGGGEADSLLRQELELLKKRLEQIESEKREIAAAYQRVEDENKDFAMRYIEIEEQNNNLANLYVASYQLHSTLDFQEVVHIVLEIIINLIGAEVFCVMLLDEKTNELGVIAQEGHEGSPSFSNIRIGEGILGNVAKSGEPYYINQAGAGYQVDFLHPIAAIPLKIKENVIGVISIYKLLVQKDAFTAVDYELFSLLAAHAATAIFSSKLYSQSERRLTTIQGFLDLLTAPTGKS